MIEHQNIGRIENRLDGTTWYDQDYVDNIQQENKQLKEELKYKPDTKWTLTTKDGKELTFIQSERIDMQEELNNTITKLFNQLKNKGSILTELEEYCEVMLRIFEKMSEEQKQEQLDKYVIYDKFLGRIQKLKEKYKC